MLLMLIAATVIAGVSFLLAFGMPDWYLGDSQNAVGILIAFTVEQDNIAKALRPAGNWLRTGVPSTPRLWSPCILTVRVRTPGAWLIPIGIMIVLSFPPLFGHELVALLCGEFWGFTLGPRSSRRARS